MNTLVDITDIESETPIIMEVSAYSLIHLKLKFLTAIMRSKVEIDNTLISIECFTRELHDNKSRSDVYSENAVANEIKKESVIRFSIAGDVWCEINTLKKNGGDILPKCISVNLYDMFNMLDNSKDELISMWIDESSNELVLNSFYNEDLDFDELEVRLPIHSAWDFPIDRSNDQPEPSTVINISAVTTFSVLKELNIENKCENLYFVFDDGKLSLVSEYNGVYAKLEMKENDLIDFGSCKSFVLPFGLFYLMSSTGQITPIRIEIYNEFIWLKAEGYTFKIALNYVEYDLSVFNNVDSEKIFVMNSEQGFAAIEKVTNLNSATDHTEITYEKVSNGVADFIATIPGRMKIFVRAIVATLSDVSISFDGLVFRDMFTKNGVDAIAIWRKPDAKLLASYETGVHRKVIVYDHNEFMKFRTK